MERRNGAHVLRFHSRHDQDLLNQLFQFAFNGDEIVEQQLSPGLELIVGGRTDPTFGKIITAGFGGTPEEWLRDLHPEDRPRLGEAMAAAGVPVRRR